MKLAFFRGRDESLPYTVRRILFDKPRGSGLDSESR
jgi:hypothetical protein